MLFSKKKVGSVERREPPSGVPADPRPRFHGSRLVGFREWSVGYAIRPCDPLTWRSDPIAFPTLDGLENGTEARPPGSPSWLRNAQRKTLRGSDDARPSPPSLARTPLRARARRRTPLARPLGPAVRLDALAMPRDMTGARSSVRPEAAQIFHLPSSLARSPDSFASPPR